MRRSGGRAGVMRPMCAVLAACIVLAGCGSSANAPPGDRISGRALTIYTSVPLHGASRADGQAVVNGEQLALAQTQYRVGRFRIAFRPLDDSTPQHNEWDPGQTSANAHIALQDRTTIGYIGEFNSGASAVSIPLLNRLEIPQVSATSTAIGLTMGGPGASPGEPEKYYPTRVRTFVRIVPNDAVQGAAQVKLQIQAGCKRTFVLDDGEVDGQDNAASFSVAAQRAGLRVAGSQSFDPSVQDYRALSAAVALSRPDCVLISAITESNAVLLTRQIAAALPKAKIFAAAGLAESTYTDAAQGGIPAALDRRVAITAATLDPAAYPPAGRAFFAAYARRYGPPQPDAIYGYEAMNLMLSAISRATDAGRKSARRSKVVSELFRTRDRRSVLGTYSINRHGDSTLRRYGVYEIVNGRLEFRMAISV